MSAFRKYKKLRRSGASLLEVLERARTDGLSRLDCIRLAREVFGVSLEKAKVAAFGVGPDGRSLYEYQEELKPSLEEALRRFEDE